VPEVRAFLLRTLLARLAARWPEDVPAVREALGPEALAALERAPAAGWVPFAWEIAVDRAVRERGGDERLRALGRELGRSALEHGLLAHLASATLGLLGRRPPVLVRLTLAGWRVATRGAGDNELLPGAAAGEVRIRFVDAPDLVRDPALLLRLSGTVEALFAHAGVAARASVDADGGAPSGVRVSWSGA
jgi:hypothetical protein